MARLPVQSGLVKRLFHSSSSNEALKRITKQSDKTWSCISCVLWPLTSPQFGLFGHPAAGWAGASGHAYHRGGSSGSSTDDEHCSSSQHSNSNVSAEQTGAASSASSSSRRNSSAGEGAGSPEQPPTAQLRDLRRTLRQQQQQLQQHQQGGREHDSDDRHEAMQLPEHIARIAMRDPLGVLISSLGVPLGISLKVNPSEALKQHTEDARTAARDQLDWQELVSSAAAHDDDDEEEASSSSSADTVSGDVDEPSTSVPDTDMQRLRQELHVKTKRFARNLRRQAAHSSSASSTDTGVPAASGAAVAAAAGDSASVQHNLDSLRALITRASGDRWGTTQQSAAEIAQQIADSNRAAGGDGGDDGDEGDDDDEDDDEPLTLTPEEERYADASAVAADLKEMDEIFEVLAKVPWLDDEDVDERELRGLAAVGLLGTLEEVGWTIRSNLLALWAGERDAEVLTAGLGPREASAMSSILYHTQQLEEQFGKPPKESVEAALAAAAAGQGSGGDVGQREGGH